MAGTADLSMYKDALLVLGTAGVVVPVLARYKVSPVLGYLIAYTALHVRRGHETWILFVVLLCFWLSVLIRAFAWLTLLLVWAAPLAVVVYAVRLR